MPLQHQFRPKTFKRFRGNESTVKALQAVLSREKAEIPHAFLFTGPSGTGKTTLARITARALECTKADFYELDAAAFRGIDSIRDIRRQMVYKPSSGPSRVWLLDECHQLTKDAQEALLKALEDTPSHVYFILATTDPQKLKITLKRRCSTFDLSPLNDTKLTSLMKSVVKHLGKEVPDEVLDQICQDSVGSAGIAMGILDSVVDLDPEDMMVMASQSAAQQNETIELCRALMAGNSWKKVSGIIKGMEAEPESIRRMVLGYCSNTLLNSGKGSAYNIMDAFHGNFYDTGKAGLVMACWEAVHPDES